MFLVKGGVAILTALSVAVVRAFDPGHISSDSQLQGHAFRHGDLEDALKPWIATRQNVTGGWQFQGGDVSQIYFGNWLRDYSQVIDTNSLKVFNADTLVTLVKLLGYLQFGSATGPYEVTSERLGVYLPVEHIDNPRNYANGQDARTYDPRLRPPVQPQELLVDPKTGMKNYMMNDSGGWDTSKAYITRQLRAAAAQGRTGGVRSEAYRLLGSALHPLEDFLAHSNFVELALIRLGYADVFPFVGNGTQISSPTGKSVYPMVTGTFGSSDVVVSFLGGIADYLSEHSVPSLKAKVQSTTLKSSLRQKYGKQNIGKLETIQSILTHLTAHAKETALASSLKEASKRQRRELRDAARTCDVVHEATKRDLKFVSDALEAVGLRPDMDEGDLTKALAGVVKFKEEVKGKVVNGLGDVVQKFGGLQDFLSDLEDNLDVFVSQNLQKLISPLVSLLRNKIQGLMKLVVIDSATQWEVFNVTTSTDPTHSLLSKDHFQSILNEPAGTIARMVTVNTVDAMVRVWEDPSADVDAAISGILQVIFHPDFVANQPSGIQGMMVNAVQSWVDTVPAETLSRLTKESISNLGNVRVGL